MNDPLDQLRLRFTGLQLVSESGHGQVYAGQDFTGSPVSVAVLSESAAADTGVRGAFADAVWRHSPGAVPEAAAVYAADLHAARPWAAIRNPVGQPGAEQLFAGLPGGTPPPPAAYPNDPHQRPTSLAQQPTSPAYQPGAPGYPPYQPASPYQPAPAYQPAPGGFGAPPGPPGVGYPGAAPAGGYPGGPPPVKSASPWPWLIGVAAAVLALVVVAGVVVVAINLAGGDEDDPLTLPPPAPAPSPAPPPETGAPAPAPSGEAELRDVEALSLLGPTWAAGEDTFTMAFEGWPFAFRTPGSWGCLRTSFDPIPEADVWTCRDEQDSDSDQRVSVMLWECSTTCTEDEQEDMIFRWLDDPEDAARSTDPLAAYVEYEENTNGNYAIDLSSFGAAGGDELRWHVGAYVESPPDEDRDVVLKVLNDVLSQSA